MEESEGHVRGVNETSKPAGNANQTIESDGAAIVFNCNAAAIQKLGQVVVELENLQTLLKDKIS